MRSIEEIIRRLGYDQSKNFFRMADIDKCDRLSWHEKKVLRTISPYAFYAADDTVVAVFFDDLNARTDMDIHASLWNAQWPVIISDEGNYVKIYNGKYIDADTNAQIRLKDVAAFEYRDCNEKNDFSWWNITNSFSMDLYEKSKGKYRLNEALITNLKYITVKLKNEYGVTFANRLILRILFIRYLIDRGIEIGYQGLDGNVEHSQEAFLRIIRDKESYFGLIRYLKEKFNGNLFEMDESEERVQITDDVLSVLYDFLTARQMMNSGQFCLFPLYDFNIIPVELISTIYEILLGDEKK